jgi:hypothetical protein
MKLLEELSDCLKMAVLWNVAPCAASFIIALMMEAVSTSEKSIDFYQTTRRIVPEDNHFLTHRRENLNSPQV